MNKSNTNTLLVIKYNKIKVYYLKKVHLLETYDIDGKKILVEENTLNSYLLLKEFLMSKNIEIGISSAYRSVDDQERIYNEFLEKYGEEYTKTHVAVPYTSEHHTGLCLDINIKVNGCFPKDNYELEEQKEYYEKIYKYLKDFGFILRYPDGKEDITGVLYEPWHIRYVGVVPASIIMNNNWTLEEYLKEFSGVIVINKKSGPTSFDVVNDVSHIFGIKKVGHTGTLDPLAEGILIIAIGKATKIVELLTSKDKEYIAEVKLGFCTDSYDTDGVILNRCSVPDDLDISNVLSSFKKTYMQEVPIYSAVKVNGKKLYEYARSGKSVTLPKKEVTIKDIELLSSDSSSFTFRTLVTKGCYIRSLIQDISKELGVYATMSRLIRTKQGVVSIDKSNTVDDLLNNNYNILSIEECLDYPIVVIDNDDKFKVSNGVRLENKWNVEDRVIFKDSNNRLLGIYEVRDNMLVTWKNFN